MRRLIIAGFLLIGGIAGLLFWALPPAAWFDRDYEDAAFEDVLQDFDELASRAEFYAGTGWLHRRYPFESALEISPGQESEKVAEVRYHRWLTIPLYGKVSLSHQILYRDPALKPDYRL